MYLKLTFPCGRGSGLEGGPWDQPGSATRVLLLAYLGKMFSSLSSVFPLAYDGQGMISGFQAIELNLSIRKQI